MSDCVIIQPIADAGLNLLRQAGLSIHVASSPSLEALHPHLAEAYAVITRNVGFSAAAIAAAPKLRVIGSHGTGVDSIDLAAAQAKGITVVNTPGANTQGVAELSFALILACAKALPAADQAVRKGDFTYRYRQTSIELAGRTLGLVGFGHIARRVAQMGQAFGMAVVAVSRFADEGTMEAHGVHRVHDLDALCAMADVVSLHTVPAEGMLFDATRLARLRQGAILINTARGRLVDEAALAMALEGGYLAAAGLDVYAVEPPSPENPLLSAPNLILAPHIGGSARESLERTAIAVASDVLRVLQGDEPLHPVLLERQR